MKTIDVTPEEIEAMVTRYLARHQPDSYRIKVIRGEACRDSDGWWEVPVRPSRRNVASYDWIGRCAEAAVDLEASEHIHVLLVPS